MLLFLLRETRLNLHYFMAFFKVNVRERTAENKEFRFKSWHFSLPLFDNCSDLKTEIYSLHFHQLSYDWQESSTSSSLQICLSHLSYLCSELDRFPNYTGSFFLMISI